MCVHLFASLGNTRKPLSILEMPSLLTPAIIRYVDAADGHTDHVPEVDSGLFERGWEDSVSCGTVCLSSRSQTEQAWPSNISLMTVLISRPSWLQAVWCRPTATLMWPWTSIVWRRERFPRAPLSGTTLACASLAKRNMWLWVIFCLVCGGNIQRQ